MYGGMSAREAATGFCAAVSERNEENAKTVCTKAGWEATVQGSPSQAYRQTVARQLKLASPGEPRLAGSRGVVPVSMTDAVGAPLAKVFLLTEERQSNHRVAGTTALGDYADLYLAGTVEAVTDWERLPESPAAREWGERAKRVLTDGATEDLGAAGADLLAIIKKEVWDLFPGTSVEILGARRLPGTPRHAVGLRFVSEGHAPRERWVGLNEGPGGLDPVRVTPVLGAQVMCEKLPG